MLDFNQNLCGLDGQEINDEKGNKVTLGQLLANQIAFTSKGDALKLFNWAQKMYAGKALDLDPTDSSTLKDLITSNETLTILAKAQLLGVFEK